MLKPSVWGYLITYVLCNTSKCRGMQGCSVCHKYRCDTALLVLIFTCLLQHIERSLPWCAPNAYNITCERALYTDESWGQFAFKTIPEASHTFKILLVHRSLQLHNVYCSSLRFSWSSKPRHPLLKMLFSLLLPSYQLLNIAWQECSSYLDMPKELLPRTSEQKSKGTCLSKAYTCMPLTTLKEYTNDLSAGSPTEALRACQKLTHAWHLQYKKDTRIIFSPVHLRKHCSTSPSSKW